MKNLTSICVLFAITSIYGKEPEPIRYFDMKIEGPYKVKKGEELVYNISVIKDPRIEKEKIKIYCSKSIQKKSISQRKYQEIGIRGDIFKIVLTVIILDESAKIIGINASGIIDKEEQLESILFAINEEKGFAMDDVYKNNFYWIELADVPNQNSSMVKKRQK